VAPAKYKEDLRVLFNCIAADLEAEYKDVEPGIKCQLESADMPEKVFTSDFAATLINTLYALPHGVMAMSRQIEGLVETSTNLASIKLINDQVVISTSQRSSIESARDNIAAMVESIFDMAGANTVHSDGYPGWAPNRKSPMLAVAIESYKRLFGIEPKVKAIHAGLECGLFLKKYPHLDMISIGPTVRGAHSPDERIHIDSVQKFWDYLLNILTRM
jgi:dipeptidase D